MGNALPKQFLELSNKPIIMHTLEAFYAFNPTTQIILVLPQNWINFWQELVVQFEFSIPFEVAIGGTTRTQSVRNGLALAKGKLIAIHDAVRPFITSEFIAKLFSAAEINGSAIPCLPLKDSLRKIEINESKAVRREEFVLVQTPQVFDAEKITKAYSILDNEDISDDASVFELLNHQIHIIDGLPNNIKITTPYDLAIAQYLIQNTKI